MKKNILKTIAMITLVSLGMLTGCGDATEKKEAQSTEIIVFAAASMTETLTELKDIYEDINPNITITYNFDSSGTLKTQIAEGAECDVFISAGQRQMDQIDISASTEVNKDRLDMVEAGTRINLLENKVILCSGKADIAIKNFDELAVTLKDENSNILFCMGNSDVPVGQYTKEIFAYYGLSEEELAKSGRITYGTNAKEVTTQIKEGSVDYGVVYGTDAYSAGLNPIDYATKEMCGQIIYPAAVMKNSKNKEAAQAFLYFLLRKDSMAVFEAVGFTEVK